jgi:predicted nucleic acid-binding protein
MIVDTSALLAWFDLTQRHRPEVVAVIESTDEPLIVSPYVVAELDHLLLSRVGPHAEVASLRELAGGAWALAAFGTADLGEAVDLIERYRDHRIGVTDASIVVLAERYKTDRILTLDRRHFSVLRQRSGKPFTILPG